MKRPLLFAAWGFVLGEVCLLLPVVWRVLTLAVLCAGAGVLWLGRKKGGRNPVVWMMPLFFVIAGMVCLHREQKRETAYELLIGQQQGQRLSLCGKVTNIQPGKERWRLEVRGDDPYPNLLVYVKEDTALEQNFFIGERIWVSGELKLFKRPGNPGEFDYAAYEHARDCWGQLSAKDVKRIGGSVSPYLDGIYRLKAKASRILECICEREDFGIFQSVVLGDKSELGEEIRSLYQKNGISHLLAVSGLHISFLGLGMYQFLRKTGCGIGASGLAAALLTVSYAVLSGSSASAVRAAMMLCFRLAADYRGRTYDLLSALAAAALVLLGRFPLLLFQAGFQLSFGAVYAMGMILPVLQRLTDVPEQEEEEPFFRKRDWRIMVLPGLAVQLMTLPIIAYHFFEYPVYSMLLNLLVIPLMSVVLISGVTGILAGAVSLAWGRAAVAGGHGILLLYRVLCQGVQNLPGAVWVTGRPSLWQILLYLAVWVVLLWRIVCRPKTKIRLTGLLGALLFGLFCLSPLPVRGMKVTFLDVGQGDGICFQTRDGVILVDGGSSSQKKLGKQVLEPFFKSCGIRTISYAIVSHGDEDHISGLVELLEQDCAIQIQNLLLPIRGRGEWIYENLERLAQKRGADVHWFRQGERIAIDGLVLECLYDGAGCEETERNNHSLLLRAGYGRTGILLTGDMSGEGENQWLDEMQQKSRRGVGNGEIQILKVSHHGSNYSSTEEFLQFVSPKTAVISCGEGNRYGHPGAETMQRLKENQIIPWITMENGAISAETDGKTIHIRGFRRKP